MPLAEFTTVLPLVADGDFHITLTGASTYGRTSATPRLLKAAFGSAARPALYVDLSGLPADAVLLSAELLCEVSAAPSAHAGEVLCVLLVPQEPIGAADSDIYSAIGGGYPFGTHSGGIASYEVSLDELAIEALQGLLDEAFGWLAIGRRLDAGSAELELGSTPAALRVTYLAEAPSTSGYRVWVDRVDGSAAEPVEQAAGVLSYVEALASLALEAHATYRVRVAAFNAAGQSDAIEVLFRTDAEGVPRLLPSVVRGVAAVPLAGGRVRVSWSYEERQPEHRADGFVIRAVSLEGAEDVQVDGVRVALAPQHAKTLELPEGLWLVKVFAALDGVWNEHVTGAPVLVRAVTPAGELQGLTAL